jgi:hypothetical protein
MREVLVRGKSKDLVMVNWESKEERKKTFNIPGMGMQVVSSNAEANKVLNTETFPVLAIMPMMAVCNSPLICVITHNKKFPFQPRYMPLLIAIWKIYRCRDFVNSACGRTTAQTEESMLKKYEEDDPAFLKWQTDLINDLKEFFARMKQGGVVKPSHPDSRACMQDFYKLMCKHTYAYMHVLETSIYNTICAQRDKRARRLDQYSLQSLLTPVEEPKEVMMTEEQTSKCIVEIQNWFSWKQYQYIDTQRILDKPKIYTHINTDEFLEIFKKHAKNPAEVCNGYMPYRTLWQYAMFLDFHFTSQILESNSQGNLIK